jgi:hypothetical protein
MRCSSSRQSSQVTLSTAAPAAATTPTCTSNTHSNALVHTDTTYCTHLDAQLPPLRLPVECCQSTPEVGSGAWSTCQGQDISSNSPPAAALDTAKGTPQATQKGSETGAVHGSRQCNVGGFRGSLSLFIPSIDSCGALRTIYVGLCFLDSLSRPQAFSRWILPTAELSEWKPFPWMNCKDPPSTRGTPLVSNR